MKESEQFQRESALKNYFPEQQKNSADSAMNLWNCADLEKLSPEQRENSVDQRW